MSDSATETEGQESQRRNKNREAVNNKHVKVITDLCYGFCLVLVRQRECSRLFGLPYLAAYFCTPGDLFSILTTDLIRLEEPPCSLLVSWAHGRYTNPPAEVIIISGLTSSK